MAEEDFDSEDVLKKVESLLKEVDRVDPTEKCEWTTVLVKRYMKIRARYTELAKNAEDGSISWENLSQDIRSTINEINAQYRETFGCKELIAEAELVDSIVNLLSNKLQTFLLNVGSTNKSSISVKEFAANIMNYHDIESNQEQRTEKISRIWMNLAKVGSEFNNSSLNFNSLVGMQQNIDGQTVREVERLRKTAQRTATVEMKGASPDEAYNDHEGSFAKSLDEMMERLEAELRIRGTDRISYYEAVLHPTDFGKTVEAMYRVAYLINEGRVIYHSTEDEIQSQLILADGREKPKKICLVQMNMAKWQHLVQSLGIQRALLRP